MNTDTHTQHTPGPWTVDDDKREDFMKTVRSSCAGRLGIAYCVPSDAGLIAAAPTMLEALRAVLDVPANEPARVVLLVPQIRDAIAKAEGNA